MMMMMDDDDDSADDDNGDDVTTHLDSASPLRSPSQLAIRCEDDHSHSCECIDTVDTVGTVDTIDTSYVAMISYRGTTPILQCEYYGSDKQGVCSSTVALLHTELLLWWCYVGVVRVSTSPPTVSYLFRSRPCLGSPSVVAALPGGTRC